MNIPRRRILRACVSGTTLLPLLVSEEALADHPRLHADGDKTSIRELMRLEHTWSNAFNHRDAKTLDLLLAEDFLFTTSTGDVVGKADYIHTVVNDIVVVNGGIDQMVIRTYDDTGVVSARFIGTEVVDGQEVDAEFRFTDVWAHRKGRWWAVASQDTTIP